MQIKYANQIYLSTYYDSTPGVYISIIQDLRWLFINYHWQSVTCSSCLKICQCTYYIHGHLWDPN